MADFLQQPALIALESIIGAALLAFLVHTVVFAVMSRFRGVPHIFAQHTAWSLRVLAVAIAVDIALAGAPVPRDVAGPLRHALALVIIAGIAWFLVRLTNVAEDLLFRRLNVDTADNRRARRYRTQISVFRRIAVVVLSVVAIAVMLTTFPQLRVMGASMLASAGIAGIVIGLAAQSTLSNLLAGIQIALTDPVRLDDVVIVENEWGRVEEITFTYVVVKIWDQRRLVLPISYFTTRPFQNWTRNEAALLGTVYLRVDYRAPLGPLRAELDRLCKSSPLWDGRVSLIQVTDTSDRDIELRILVSTEDSPKGWDLRCYVREGLVQFLQENYPETLPRVRAEVSERPVAFRELAGTSSR